MFVNVMIDVFFILISLEDDKDLLNTLRNI